MIAESEREMGLVVRRRRRVQMIRKQAEDPRDPGGSAPGAEFS